MGKLFPYVYIDIKHWGVSVNYFFIQDIDIMQESRFHEKDRDNLIGRRALLLPETQTTCYAWVLMPGVWFCYWREIRGELHHLSQVLNLGG